MLILIYRNVASEREEDSDNVSSVTDLLAADTVSRNPILDIQAGLLNVDF